MFKVSERICEAGSGDKPNEDGYAVVVEGSKMLYVVIDGVNGIDGSMRKLPVPNGARSKRRAWRGGVWATYHLRRFWDTELDLKKCSSALRALVLADRYLRRVRRELHAEDRPAWHFPAAAACAVLIDHTSGEVTWAQAADCIGVFELMDGTISLPVDPMVSIERKALRAMARYNDFDHGKVQKVLRENRRMRNEKVYPVLDGNLNSDLVKTGQIPLEDIRQFTLFSDGIFSPGDDLQNLGKRILDEDADTIVREVRAREDADPLLQNPVRFNNDDKTVMVVRRTMEDAVAE